MFGNPPMQVFYRFFFTTLSYGATESSFWASLYLNSGLSMKTEKMNSMIAILRLSRIQIDRNQLEW